jgi:hypothetical protein
MGTRDGPSSVRLHRDAGRSISVTMEALCLLLPGDGSAVTVRVPGLYIFGEEGFILPGKTRFPGMPCVVAAFTFSP